MALLLAGAAWACPVCGAASSNMNQGTYLVMTIVLSLLPLGMVGGLVWWVATRASAGGGAP